MARAKRLQVSLDDFVWGRGLVCRWERKTDDERRMVKVTLRCGKGKSRSRA